MSPLSISLRRLLTHSSARNRLAISGQCVPASELTVCRLCQSPIHRPFFLNRRFSSSYITKPILPDVWEFDTVPFGKLIVEAPFHVDVRPLDPHSCPGQDRIQVTLKNEEEQLQPEWMEGVQCQVDHDPKKHVLRVWGDLTESGHALFPSLECLPVILEVFIPIKYDVQISTWHHGRVSVKGLECESVEVVTEAGVSYLGGLKAGRIQVASGLGDINVGGTLYGDIRLLTGGAGSLNVHKVQGSLTASTEVGSLWVKSAYLTHCNLATNGGDIRVTNLTGSNNQVSSIHGDVTLDSVDGCLEVKTQTGNIAATFSRVPSTPTVAARVLSDSGDIDLKVETEVSADVILAGEEIFVDERLGPPEVIEEGGPVGDTGGDDDKNNSAAKSHEATEIALRQVGVKVGVRKTDTVIQAVSKLGKVSLSKKEWFGAFKFGS